MLFLSSCSPHSPRGAIQIFNQSPKVARHCIGWVPQNLQFDSSFPISVQEVVLGGRLTKGCTKYSRKDYQIVEECLAKVGLNKSLKAPFAPLSGGEKQRVIIARALACHPAILLLDEPMTGLDHSGEQIIHHLLHELRKTTTILMVTHNLNRMINKADRLLCVQGSISPMTETELCEYFSMGLYHN